MPDFRQIQPGELGTAVILGEFVHDLRSALDYIVAALADKEQIRLTQYHQFPIAYTRGGYTKAVKDCLRGISDVPAAIDHVQPYHLKADPDSHALALLNRLSNTDKHRSLVVPLSL